MCGCDEPATGTTGEAPGGAVEEEPPILIPETY